MVRNAIFIPRIPFKFFNLHYLVTGPKQETPTQGSWMHDDKDEATDDAAKRENIRRGKREALNYDEDYPTTTSRAQSIAHYNLRMRKLAAMRELVARNRVAQQLNSNNRK